MNVVIVIAEEEGESSEAFPYHIVNGVGLRETEPGTERENWQEDTARKRKKKKRISHLSILLFGECKAVCV